VRMRGETREGAVLNFGVNNIRLLTALGSNISEFRTTNRPEQIEV
jgi:hypothetical protein